ncbi:MAG: ABC transporter ATP-binding protein [Myxococcota bacterium]|nr:ABC transporter ATP-binding protein [Myxococcota bacterium]
MSQHNEMKLLLRLWPFARPDRRFFGFALLLTPLAMLGSLAQPLLLKEAIDNHIVTGEVQGLYRVALFYVLVVLLTYLVEAAYMLSLALAGQRTIVRLRESIYRHLLTLSSSFFDTRPAGGLMTRATSDVESLGEALTSGVVTIVLDILVVIGVLVVMFSMDWRLTLILLAVTPPLLFVLQVCRLRLRDLFLLIRDSLAHLNAFLAERINGIEVIQLFNHEAKTHEEFCRRNAVFRDASIRSNIYDALMYAFVDGTGRVCIALMLWYGSSSVTSGTVTAGLLVAFIDYLDRLFRPLQQFSGKVAIIQRALAALNKIFRLLEESEQIEDTGIELENVKGRIQFRNVSFSYNQETLPDILRDIDLDIKPGEVVALVGPTGCGKTTLSRLLTRSYDGDRGSITIDGQEIREVRPRSLRSHVAAVHQDVHIFPDSIRFNVGMGNPTIGSDRLQAAADLVHAGEFIEALPDTWEHSLRNRGANLSSGEGQLLTFARTMAYDPVMVILDEATAAVDSITEAQIQFAIQKIFKQKTVLVIAHRLSTIAAADRILVMNNGRIAEQGRHQDLLRQDGLYAELVRKGLSAATG